MGMYMMKFAQPAKTFRVGALVTYEYTDTYGSKCKVVKKHKADMFDEVTYDVLDTETGKMYYHCTAKNVSKYN